MRARRFQSATVRTVKALRNAPLLPLRSHPMAFHAKQIPFAFGSRSFSSSPSEGMTDVTPTEAINHALDASDKIDFKSISELGTSLSDLAIRALDIVHSTTGLPWYATIFVTTLAIRTAMFPITLKSLRNSDRMKLFQPELEKIKEEMDNQPRDSEALATFRAKYLKLKEKHQINPFLGPLLPMSQIPIFLGFFWGLQEISQYFPDYASGGTLWFQDLSVADPTYALPVISSIIMIGSVEAGKDALPAGWGDNAIIGMRVMGLALIPFTLTFQSGVLVYWVSSNLYTLIQTALIRVPLVRKTLKLAPLGSSNSIKLLKTAGGTSPFSAAVARAQGATINTHTYSPKQHKQQGPRKRCTHD